MQEALKRRSAFHSNHVNLIGYYHVWKVRGFTGWIVCGRLIFYTCLFYSYPANHGPGEGCACTILQERKDRDRFTLTVSDVYINWGIICLHYIHYIYLTILSFALTFWMRLRCKQDTADALAMVKWHVPLKMFAENSRILICAFNYIRKKIISSRTGILFGIRRKLEEFSAKEIFSAFFLPTNSKDNFDEFLISVLKSESNTPHHSCLITDKNYVIGLFASDNENKLWNAAIWNIKRGSVFYMQSKTLHS